MPHPIDPYFDEVNLGLFMQRRLRQLEEIRERKGREEEQRQREREQLEREFRVIRNDRRWHIITTRLLRQWWNQSVVLRVLVAMDAN